MIKNIQRSKQVTYTETKTQCRILTLACFLITFWQFTFKLQISDNT